MADAPFSDDERTELATKLRTWLLDEADADIGRFDAEFLVDFIVETVGPRLYDAGVKDAQALLQTRFMLTLEEMDALRKVP